MKRHHLTHRSPIALAIVLAAGLAGSPAAFAAEPQSTISDEWLEARLMTTYTLNRHLNPFELDVEVDDGVAKLAGRVDNEVEHDLALEIARGLDGIERVDDRIRVKPMQSEEKSMSQKVGEEASDFASDVNDATITASVKMRLLWNRNTDGLDINVTTHRGRVTLDGTVDSAAKRDLAGQIAANTHDVREVDNRLRIRTAMENQETVGEKVGKTIDQAVEKTGDAVEEAGEAVSDTWITTKVAATLDNSQDVDSADIRVSTENGIVTLKGRVASAAERERAPEIAADVKGVRGIDNRLRIDQRVSQESYGS